MARLEKRHKAATGNPKGVIGGRFNGTYVEEIGGVLYLRREELPGGFEVFARNQQNALQAELRTILSHRRRMKRPHWGTTSFGTTITGSL